jgi:hypothetical protein
MGQPQPITTSRAGPEGRVGRKGSWGNMWREGAGESLIGGAEEMADSNTDELVVVLKTAEGVWRSLWETCQKPQGPLRHHLLKLVRQME